MKSSTFFLVQAFSAFQLVAARASNGTADSTTLQSFGQPVGQPVGGFVSVRAGRKQTPFPQWLTDFTGLNEWPGVDPPYIPMDFIDFKEIPDYKRYEQGVCGVNPPESCSFDCDRCLAPDDVYTCRRISQTFDDGPSLATERLLNSLDHKTTFFNLGMNIVNFPDMYHKILDNGHLVGTHTWSHPFMPSLTNEQIIAQLQWSIWAMNATGHHLPKWFRPPYGAIDNRVRSIARMFGLQAVLWDHDTFDWQLLAEDQTARTEEDIYKEVQDWKRSGTGLILEHDGTFRTVQVGVNVDKILGNNQLTVAECVGGIDYIRTFPQNLKPREVEN
ncbi:LAME_0H03466g1_1 [Lachancea meyersii CBS 8951]|uniref:chitin deacetylase n=1 Tax=Lachancea meyersii CBS 8951 TaxID=1266667 RepID=A0A1G4KDL5_9SACH|nr:LAME_0H03466g1_1 [Lachancea meyersii CBS 8951]